MENINFSDFIALLLARLYELEKVLGPGKFINLNVIAKDIKQEIPRQWVYDAGKVLESRGLTRNLYALGGMVSAELTGHGRLYVEESRNEDGIIKKYTEQPNLFFVEVKGTGNQVNVSGASSSVQQTLTLSPDKEAVIQALNDLRDSLVHSADISDDQKKEFKADLESIEKQLVKERPNKTVIAELLEPMSQISSIAGSAANFISLLAG